MLRRMAEQVPVDLKKWMTKVLTHFCLFLGKSGSSDKVAHSFRNECFNLHAVSEKW